MLKRGVILAGGFGTRMGPATHSTNKHLLPVYTEDGAVPMIEYPIRTLIQLGCKEILIITSKDHCGLIVDYLGDGYEKGVSFTYKIQEMNDPNRPAGIASALKLCKDFTKDDPFVVILGDNFFEENEFFSLHVKTFSDRNVLSHIFLYETEEWRRFGVAELGILGEVVDIVEKPTRFISNLAVTGMYVYTSDVYTVAETLTPSNRGELEITDINKHYAANGELTYSQFETFWSDMGTPESMKKTIDFIEKQN